MTVYSRLERRSGQDRRQQQFSKRLFFKGVRESTRRTEDRNRIAVFDRYEPNLIIGIIVILSLSMIDAILTLTLISQGAKELNPLMRYYLSHGPEIFISVKYGLTALPMLIILFANEALANRYQIGAGVLFNIFGAFFIGVVFWEVFLLFRF
jgi:Domain of unknown function (DUF5658)